MLEDGVSSLDEGFPFDEVLEGVEPPTLGEDFFVGEPGEEEPIDGVVDDDEPPEVDGEDFEEEEPRNDDEEPL